MKARPGQADRRTADVSQGFLDCMVQKKKKKKKKRLEEELLTATLQSINRLKKNCQASTKQLAEI